MFRKEAVLTLNHMEQIRTFSARATRSLCALPDPFLLARRPLTYRHIVSNFQLPAATRLDGRDEQSSVRTNRQTDRQTEFHYSNSIADDLYYLSSETKMLYHYLLYYYISI